MSSELLGIGTSSLTALRKTLDTIGHNISNANNPDYNRQITDLASRTPIRSGNGFSGTGVQVVGTRRILDGFLLDSVRQNTSLTNELAVSVEYAKQLDKILGDNNTGISEALGDFFSSIEALNSNPNSMPVRQLFLSKASFLQNRFNDLYKKSMSENSNINSQVTYTVAQINGLSKSVANLNIKILGMSTDGNAGGNLPNDLLDQRDGLINELSSLVDVSTISQDNGVINVFIGNGQSLVMNGVNTILSAKNNPTDASKTDVIVESNGFVQNITNTLSGGKLGGALSSRDLILNTTLNSLGRLAMSIASVMNQQHQKGIDINANLGEKLFTDFNQESFTLQRAVPSLINSGNGIIKVSVNSINILENSHNTVFSNGEIPQPTASLSYLNTSAALTINGIHIRPVTLLDDTVSTSDNKASAIATAKAINDAFVYHGVQAAVEPNVVFLGDFIPGNIVAGELNINNVDIVSIGNNINTLLLDINSKTSVSGVEASIDKLSGKISLTAQDGRNIVLKTTGTSGMASFTNFPLSTGASDLVQRSMIKLLHSESEINISGTNPMAVGFVSGEKPIKGASLTTSDYELSYNGNNYSLKRSIDDVLVGQSLTPNFNVDGMTISLQAGTIKPGDVYNINTMRTAAKYFNLNITQPEKIALAMPLRVQSNIENQGNGSIFVHDIRNVDGAPPGDDFKYGNAFQGKRKLDPPIKIEFISDTEYKIMDVTIGHNRQIGPVQKYDTSKTQNIIFPIGSTPDYHQPGFASTYSFDPGYSIAIVGSPKKGDVFSIDYNIQAQGDNRNGLMLSQLSNKKVMSSNNATFQSSYTELVGNIANETSKLKMNLEASEGLLNSIIERKNDYSGVNLDEEAANLLKFEQAYAASAHLISAARNLFDILMSTFTR